MFKVYFWDVCPITGRFLNWRLFDSQRDARKFAKLHGAEVSHVMPR